MVNTESRRIPATSGTVKKVINSSELIVNKYKMLYIPQLSDIVNYRVINEDSW